MLWLPGSDAHQNEVIVVDEFKFCLKGLKKGCKTQILPCFVSDLTDWKTLFATLGSNIKRIRLAQGLTQQKLAKQSKVALSNLAAYERDEVKRPNSHTVQRIARGGRGERD